MHAEKGMARHRLAVALVVFTAFGGAWAEPLTHENAPRLTDSEFERLRSFIAFSLQDADDRLVHMAYALALQQYHSVPAYRDLYRDVLAGFIERMMGEPVVEFWNRLGAAKKSDSGRSALVEHTVHLIALYEMLYRDGRWSSPDASDVQMLEDEDYAALFDKLIENIERESQALPDADRLHGLRDLHDAPWDLKDFNHPVVANVDFPKVVVRQAIWIEERQTLLFILEPQEDSAITTFRINSIPTNFIASLYKENELIAAIDEHGQAAGARVRNLDPGEIEITTSLDGPTRFTLQAY